MRQVPRERPADGTGSQRLLLEHGVRLHTRDDPAAQALMREFIAREPEIWREDIGLDWRWVRPGRCSLPAHGK